MATLTIDNIELGTFTRAQLTDIIKKYISGLTASAESEQEPIAKKIARLGSQFRFG